MNTQVLPEGSRRSQDKKREPLLYELLATGLIPEVLIRLGIRSMLRQKLRELDTDQATLAARTKAFSEALGTQPIAIEVDAANDQHYELPPQFFLNVLGPQLKYSCCHWDKSSDLAAAETEMLELTCERARIADGMKILDMGCGWGAFSLYAATRFPNSQITAISNSAPQREFIELRARSLGVRNLQVITEDINRFDTTDRFDRVVSVEMLEHVKNYRLVFEKVARWMQADGKFFVHVFSHKVHQYHFQSSDPNDWLSRHFFTGGTMPSDDLLLHFQEHVSIVEHWRVNGTHYQKTAEAWLQNMAKNRSAIMPIIERTYGADQGKRWWVYWRMFFLACAELWGYSSGNEWIVSHYLFEKRAL